MPVLDVFTHILPPGYLDELRRRTDPGFFSTHVESALRTCPTVGDVNLRLQVLEKYDGYSTILTMSIPPVELAVGPKDAVQLSKIANDSMADLVRRYPQRFKAAVACLPMNDIDSALEEIERCIQQLEFRGILLYAPTGGVSLDDQRFFPIYQKMVEHDLPIWIHPIWDRVEDGATTASQYLLTSMFSLPWETTRAMTHMVFSGVMETFPTLKIITHHCGAMVPFFSQRIVGGFDYQTKMVGPALGKTLREAPVEYFKRFYADTAIYGSTSALMCGYEFFGVDKLLFGTDFPFDDEVGHRWIRETLASVDRMGIDDIDKSRILYGNAERLLRL